MIMRDGNLKTQNWSYLAKIAVISCAIIGYIPIFFWLYSKQGAESAALVILPVVIIAWLWGKWVGLLSGLLAFPLNTILLNLASKSGWDVILRDQGGAGSIAVLFIGVIVGYMSDLSQDLNRELMKRRQAEETLRQSEDQYRRLVEYSPYGIVIHTQGKVSYLNPTAMKLTGAKSAEEVLGKPVIDFVHPESRSAVLQRLREMSEGKDAPPLEEKFVCLDGTVIDVEVTAYPLIYQNVPAVQVVFQNITDRKLAEMALRASQERYRSLYEDNPSMYFTVDPDGTVLSVNRFGCEQLGYTAQELIGQSVLQVFYGEDKDAAVSSVALCVNNPGQMFHWELRKVHKTGRVMWVKETARAMQELDGRTVVFIVCEDITDHRKAEEKLRAAEERFRSIFENAGEGIFQSALGGSLLLANPTLARILGYDSPEDAVHSLTDIVKQLYVHPEDRANLFNRLEMEGGVQDFVTEFYRKDRSTIWISSNIHAIKNPQGEIVYLQGLVTDITERKQAEEDLRAAETRYRNLVEQIPLIVYTARPEQHLGVTYISPQIESLGFTQEAWIADPELWLRQMPPEDQKRILTEIDEVKAGRKPFRSEYRLLARDGKVRWFYDEAIQVRDIYGKPLLLQGFMLDITERKQAEEQIQRQLRRLNALHTIDMAIGSSFDLHMTLEVLLHQVISQLSVDAADILLINQSQLIFEYAADRGFHSNVIQHSRLSLSEGFAGRAIFERRIVHIPNLMDSDVKLTRSLALANESFVSYFGVPLIVKGEVKGVLEIFDRIPKERDEDWSNFLEALGAQAAIAIDNAQLNQDLQRSNMELLMAYNATIEGWSRAMDLRDKETEGHTQRVTDLTLELARAMNISESQLIHIRRGALLHDIGKMGVPDNILLKADQLTDEEWEKMRKHPDFAYDMLSSIRYLQPALDIPYCHHEKWDGSGYPRGLKGEEIPLSARIFAAADVWDAVTSNRSYRPAWTKEKALEYIREQSGKYFDPEVIDVFLRFMADK